MHDEQRTGMRVISPRRTSNAKMTADGGTVFVMGADQGFSYGCGRCAAPIIVDMQKRRVDSGLCVNDVSVSGFYIRCSRCGTVNDTSLPLVSWIDFDSHFLDTLEDLDQRLMLIKLEYDSLVCAAIVRKLLLDGLRLADTVNRTRRLRLHFTINDLKIPQVPTGEAWAAADAFDPSTAVHPNPIRVSRDAMLSRIVLVSGPNMITVNQLVRHLAHVEGGVHVGEPPNPRLDPIMELREFWRIDGLPIFFASMPAIARVVRAGLAPLRAAIESDFET